MKKILTARGWRSASVALTLSSIGVTALIGLAQDAPPPVGVAKLATPAGATTLPVVAAEHPCVAPPPGLLLWLPGEEKADDIFANKVLIDENVTYAPGKVGQAFNLRGAGLKIPATPKLDIGTGAGFTLEAWINPSDVQPQHPIFDFNNGTDFGVHLWIFSLNRIPGMLYANFMDTAGNAHIVTTQADAVKAGVWQHIAMIYDKKTGQASLYVNGLPAAQSPVGQFRPQTTYDLILGYRLGGLGKGMSYSGLMDEVSVYNRPLSEIEIRSIVQAGPSGKCNPQNAKVVVPPATTKSTPTPVPTPTPTPRPTPTPTLIPAVKLRQPLAAFTFAAGKDVTADLAVKITDGLTEALRQSGVVVKPRQHMDRVFATLSTESASHSTETVKTPDQTPGTKDNASGEALAPALRDASLRRRAAQQMSASTIIWGEIQQVAVTKGQTARLTLVVRLTDATTGVAVPEVVVSESLEEQASTTSPEDTTTLLVEKAITSAVARIKPLLSN